MHTLLAYHALRILSQGANEVKIWFSVPKKLLYVVNDKFWNKKNYIPDFLEKYKKKITI